ncbi:MAG: hypothetical protein IKD08_04095 [Alphaproteobacteria bacterium]|nr:hypothetical protein [Alphaproteobacteria bacterium]
MLYDRDYDEEIRVREEKYKIISDERHELYTEYDALPYFSEEAKAKRALWEQKNKESHVIGAEISRIKKWRDFVYETQIMEDHPYPFMEKYFTDIIGKLLGNDNIREQCPELASLEGKVKLWWSNDDNGVFIFASKNGKPARFSLKDGDKIEDFTWNISVNPLILYRLKSFKGNKLAEWFKGTYLPRLQFFNCYKRLAGKLGRTRL